jgi:hypothetical protein
MGKIGQVPFGIGLVGKVTWEDRISFDGGQVRLDVRVIIGRARSAEQLLS